jgi:hypothetical protein
MADAEQVRAVVEAERALQAAMRVGVAAHIAPAAGP